MDRQRHLGIDSPPYSAGATTGPHLLALIDAPDPRDSSFMPLMEITEPPESIFKTVWRPTPRS
jgi:hypothetical protein